MVLSVGLFIVFRLLHLSFMFLCYFCILFVLFLFFFFFQAEDGIRDLYVTGVQTCALPICRRLVSVLDYEVDQKAENDYSDGIGEIGEEAVERIELYLGAGDCQDRKSTRLNSSHVEISYAVFCLKKKKKKKTLFLLLTKFIN